GFKWFVPGLLDGSVVFGGEESAGASFLQRDGSTWTTDKDGIILALLASEITAVTGRSPSELYADLRPRRHCGQPGAEGGAGPALPGSGQGRRTRGGEDHRSADYGTRQRRP